MANDISFHTASELVYTGKGHIAGIIVTSTSVTPSGCTIYDAITDGGGHKLFEVMVNSYTPIFFFPNDRYILRFHDGCFIHLGLNLYATLFCHEVTIP